MMISLIHHIGGLSKFLVILRIVRFVNTMLAQVILGMVAIANADRAEVSVA